MMEDSIRNFPQQFLFEPVIESGQGLKAFPATLVVAGMGGSHLAGGILQMMRPELTVMVHHDYGLPAMAEHLLNEGLLIVSSYSGNTEEALDAAREAHGRKLPFVAVTSGGKLWEFAFSVGLPCVRLPESDIQPRMALGYSLRAMLKIIGDESGLSETRSLAATLDPGQAEIRGKKLSHALQDKVPLIYASVRNRSLAHIWKIKLNETGKIPAFCNVFPELNHNEMTGFDVIEHTRSLSDKFFCVFLMDPLDDERIKKRMTITKEMLQERGLPTETILFERQAAWEKIFQSLLTADWTAYYLAKAYGAEPDAVPMVEELKARMFS